MVRAHPATRFLARFDTAENPTSLPILVTPESPPAVDHAALLAAERESARAEGFDEGFAAARLEGEATLATARAEAETELAAARGAWVEDEAARLTGLLDAGLETLAADIADGVDQVLRPFLTVAMRERALADLKVALGRLERDGPLLRITGPEDLLIALQAADAVPARGVEFVVGPAPDVTVVAGATLIETRLAAWAAGLTEAEPTIDV